MDAASAFQLAVHMVLIEEGPMSDDKVNDANGGLTKFGISQVQNPKLDVASLTQEQAIAYYKTQYWDANNLDKMPWPLNYVVFDIDVNNGDHIGAVLVQRALGLKDDGNIGPITEGVANASRNVIDLCMRTLAKRAVYYTELGNWPGNAEGWMYRSATVAYNCSRHS